MSGIYIPDLSMPKNCYDCPFGADVDIGVGIAHGCNLIKDFAQFADERHTDCPLVPVPEHGRLVEVLKTERECVSRNCDRDCGRCDLSLERNEILSVYDALLAMFADQTIIPASKEEK